LNNGLANTNEASPPFYPPELNGEGGGGSFQGGRTGGVVNRDFYDFLRND